MQSTEDKTTESNCWKRIGVWGRQTPRCPKLAEVIHCRNCEVFTDAGRSLLEGDLPEEYTIEWAEVMAAEKEDDPSGTTTVVIFQIGEEWLALAARIFAEVMAPEPPHSIPGRRNPVLLGLVNVHGELHLCISLENLLGLERPAAQNGERDPHRHMIVLDKEGDRWVFPADEVHGIHRISLELVQNTPVTVSKGESTFTKGIFEWRERNIAFLDEDLLFSGMARSVQ